MDNHPIILLDDARQRSGFKSRAGFINRAALHGLKFYRAGHGPKCPLYVLRDDFDDFLGTIIAAAQKAT